MQTHKKNKILVLALASMAIVMGLFSVSTANAATSVQRPFPTGINQVSASKAWEQVASRASVDSSYARAIAVAGGSSSYASAEYEVVGYGKVTAGTNSAVVTSTGNTAGVPDTAVCKKGAKALILKDKRTSKKIEICTGCGNIRLQKGPLLRSVKWKKGTTLNVNRSYDVPFSGTCPDGRVVSGIVPIKLKGKIKAKAWGTIAGKLTARVQASYKLALKAGKVKKLDCGSGNPPAKPTPPGDIVIVNVCGNQGVAIGNGNAVNAVGDNCNTVVVPPETCEDRGDCPKPSTARCVSLNVRDDLMVARGISFSVLPETTGGAELTNVTLQIAGKTAQGQVFNDTVDNGTSTTGYYLFANYGTYTVVAVLTFRRADGSTGQSSCDAIAVTKKESTSGQGSNTPGQPGGSGVGGTPGTGSGPKCRNQNGDLVDGTPDQLGNC